ncbi:hypothetical protein STENM36S_05551 [Streptomyces tendae]
MATVDPAPASSETCAAASATSPRTDVRTLTMPVLPAPSDPNRVVADQPDAADLWESLR